MPEQDTQSQPTHESGTRKGEEMVRSEGRDEGRADGERSHANRPAGTRTARDATGINPDEREPISPNSPNMPPA